MRIPKPDEAERAALIERAAAMDLVLGRLATDDADERDGPRVAGMDIWRAAVRGEAEALARVGAAARVDPGTARAFARSMREVARASFPALRAADSGSVSVREADGWTIELRRSESRAGRVFVVVHVPAGRPAPAYIHATIGEIAVIAPLPAAQDGIVQLMTDESDPLVAAIGDRAATLTIG